MANWESSSSSSSGHFRLVDLKLPTLDDQNIITEVQDTRSRNYQLVSREPLRVTIFHILKPATDFLDSIFLDKTVSEDGNDTETSNLSEFDSTLSNLSEFLGGRCLSISSILERLEICRASPPEVYICPEFSTISELRMLAGHQYLMTPTHMMDEAARNDMQLLDGIILHKATMDILGILRPLSWSAKEVNTMGCFVLKYLEFLGSLLNGPNQPLTKIVPSMVDLKENPPSIIGSPLEKFLVPLIQLNNLLKLTLKVIEYTSDLTLLSDTEHSKEDHLPLSVYWTILSVVACYIQITLLIQNGEVALELSHLISNFEHIHNDLQHHCAVLKPQIEEMDGHLERIAFLKDVLENENKISDIPIEMPELMKRFLYSKDDQHSLFDGSTMTKVGVEVLKDKALVLFVSELDVDPWRLTQLQKIYEELKEEDYYKILWLPFVLKWTEELRRQFENLKSIMPWYTVCCDSPIAGVWYIKGRVDLRFGLPAFRVVDPQNAFYNQIAPGYFLGCNRAKQFPFKRPFPVSRLGGGAARPILTNIYDCKPLRKNDNEDMPSSGFKCLLAMNRGGRSDKESRSHEERVNQKKSFGHQVK